MAMGFIKAWGLIIFSLCYSFCVAKLVQKGIRRLTLIIPVFLIFFIVPLFITSIHLVCITAFFIAWLANFKLYLFALGRGPLSSNPNPLTLPIFLAVSCLPVKIQLNPRPPPTPHPSHGGFIREGLGLNYTTKAVLVVLYLILYDYITKLPEKAVLTFYAIYTYYALELILAATAAVFRTMSGLDLEPHFNDPFMATSLQNFWGRRWNLMVSGILRPTVYEPTLQLFSVLGPKWSRVPAVFWTFVVSGIMHELIFFYIGRLRPEWMVMWFFLVNGFCTAAEIAIKKTIDGRWRLPTAVGRVLTLGFVTVTSVWLFFPELKRCNIFERSRDEYAAISAFVAEIRRNMIT